MIKLWDVGTGRMIRDIVRIAPRHKFWRVTALSSDGMRLVGTVDGDVRVWDAISGQEIMAIGLRCGQPISLL